MPLFATPGRTGSVGGWLIRLGTRTSRRSNQLDALLGSAGNSRLEHNIIAPKLPGPVFNPENKVAMVGPWDVAAGGCAKKYYCGQ